MVSNGDIYHYLNVLIKYIVWFLSHWNRRSQIQNNNMVKLNVALKKNSFWFHMVRVESLHNLKFLLQHLPCDRKGSCTCLCWKFWTIKITIVPRKQIPRMVPEGCSGSNAIVLDVKN